MTTSLFKKKIHPNYVRNFIFGAEDSLVSTVGVLFGVASANSDLKFIVLTGLVVIAVEALSMGAGAFLSESSATEFGAAEDEDKTQNPVVDGIIMFFSYFFSGFIPLIPYVLLELNQAKVASVLFTLATLFLLGYMPAKKVSSAIRMVVIAGLAVFVGFAIGTGVEHFF